MNKRVRAAPRNPDPPKPHSLQVPFNRRSPASPVCNKSRWSSIVRLVVFGLAAAFVFRRKYDSVSLEQQIISSTSTGQVKENQVRVDSTSTEKPKSSTSTGQENQVHVDSTSTAKPNSSLPLVVSTAPTKQAVVTKDKPVFVLHVGLHNCGIAFLQAALCGKQQYGKANGILNKDKFEYLGTGHKKPCLGHNGEYNSKGQRNFFQQKWSLEGLIQSYHGGSNNSTDSHGGETVLSSFRDHVEQTRKRGQNAIVVFEELSGVNSRQVQALANLLTPHWNVQVLVAYQPLYSWLMSYQIQLNHQPVLASSWQSKSHFPFDLDDERPISTIGLRAIESYKKHPAELVRDKYKQSFDNVHVIPLHVLPEKWGEGDSQLGYIFCQVLKTLTPHTCQQVESGALGRHVVSNPSVPNNSYDVLAERAYEKKLIPLKSSRTMIIDKIRKEQESKKLHASEFDLKCTSKKALDRFESLSLELERQLFHENWTDTSEAAHHAGFEKMLATKSHCHLDADKILENKSWQEFFKKL
jgi:hypothetical protein